MPTPIELLNPPQFLQTLQEDSRNKALDKCLLMYWTYSPTFHPGNSLALLLSASFLPLASRNRAALAASHGGVTSGSIPPCHFPGNQWESPGVGRVGGMVQKKVWELESLESRSWAGTREDGPSSHLCLEEVGAFFTFQLIYSNFPLPHRFLGHDLHVCIWQT